MQKVLITGAIGFIGFHLALRLINEGYELTGIDNIDDYYDVSLKYARLKILKAKKQFSFIKLDLSDREGIKKLFNDFKFDIVVNLAAQAGVRYSIENPYKYIKSNIEGFINILEGCRCSNVKHLVFASSSSVYGANKKMPFSVHHNVDHPISIYAATKKSNELMAHTYSALYNIPSTGLRFFTVYGPWGRPDMAYFKFTKSIIEGKPIDVYNYGNMKRDFTYIDDITEGLSRVIKKIPVPDSLWNANNPDPGTSFAPYKLYNIGNNRPVNIMDFISIIEKNIGIKAKINMMPMQMGDVTQTYADINDLIKDTGFMPETDINKGIMKFVDWYKLFYNV